MYPTALIEAKRGNPYYHLVSLWMGYVTSWSIPGHNKVDLDVRFNLSFARFEQHNDTSRQPITELNLTHKHPTYPNAQLFPSISFNPTNHQPTCLAMSAGSGGTAVCERKTPLRL